MNQTAMLERFVRETDIDCVMVAGRYSLLDDRAVASLLPICAERGVGVIIGGVFNSGILAEAGVGSYFDYKPASPQLLDRARRLREMTTPYGVPLPAAVASVPLAGPQGDHGRRRRTFPSRGAGRRGLLHHAYPGRTLVRPRTLWAPRVGGARCRADLTYRRRHGAATNRAKRLHRHPVGQADPEIGIGRGRSSPVHLVGPKKGDGRELPLGHGW